MLLEFNRKLLPVGLTAKERKYFTDTMPFLSRNARGELVVSSKFFSDIRTVQDVHRYDLLYVEDQWVFTKPGGTKMLTNFASNQHDTPIVGRPNQLVLLLESPHKDEYGSDGSALGPALGESGKNIFSLFCSHVLPILENLGMLLDKRSRYPFCIANPVPYQASLVDIHKADKLIEGIRNKAWMALWPECEVDFMNHLQQYQPSILLNGCTRDLKAEVKLVVETLPGVQQFDVTHPSAWTRSLAGFRRT